MNEAKFNFEAYEGLGQWHQLDTSERKRTYIIVDRNGTHLRLSGSAYLLLAAAYDGVSFDELAARVNRTRPSKPPVSAQQLSQRYERLVEDLTRIERELAAQRRLPWGFWLRRAILHQNSIKTIVQPFKILYSRWIGIVSIFLIAGTLLYCSLGNIGAVAPSSLFYGYLLFIGSMFAHELGHATASAKYAAEPTDIGFAMYLIYPALYSDVTPSWKLNRRQRVLVDLGGCYFQLLFAVCLLPIFKLTGWEALRICILLIAYACVFSLNPIFKFDGYWVVTDVLGVTNLGSQVSRLRRYSWNLLIRRKSESLPWPGQIVIILLLYSLVSTVVWASFCWKIVPAIIGGVKALFSIASLMISQIHAGSIPRWPEIRSMLVSIYFLTIVVAMLWQMGKRLIAASVKQRQGKDPSRPAGYTSINAADNQQRAQFSSSPETSSFPGD